MEDKSTTSQIVVGSGTRRSLGDQRRRRRENGNGALDGGEILWHRMIDE